MSTAHRELADFLRRARAASDPQRAGLPTDGRIRRVPGLRREEVALLAGVSTDYYTRLEQGRRIIPSAQVLDAVARALDLDDAGQAHLRDLVNAGGTPRARDRRSVQRVRPGLQQLLASFDGQPAMILGRRTDVLAINRLGRVLFTDFERMPARERNYARWMLLSDEARTLFLDWEVQARNAVAALRLDTGRNPDDAQTQQLVGELSVASTEFRRWWSEHHVYRRSYGTKRLHHPIVGQITLDYETLTFPADADQALYVYTAAHGTASQQSLGLLASWTQPTGAAVAGIE